MNKQKRGSNNAASHIENELPLPVTKISVQKKNREQYSLFNNNRFLVGISRKTLEDFAVREGVTLTLSLYRKLCNAEDLTAIRETCFRYLSQRDHSSIELKQKVGKKGFDKRDIERVLEDLSHSGYLDDEAFAAKFTDEKTELNQWGPKKIRAHLFKKGIDRKVIDKVIAQKTDNLQLQQICVDLVLKRKNHFLREDDVYKRKQKIFRYLAGRGFSGSVIKKSYPRITDKLNA